MADWYGSARSNYFGIKDEASYKIFCDRWNIVPIQDGKKWGFVCSLDDKGGLPSYTSDENNDEEYDFDDFVDELSKQLKPSHVAIMMECGAEKLRYVTGFALAVNSNGTTKTVSLNDIYKKADRLGKHRTCAES